MIRPIEPIGQTPRPPHQGRAEQEIVRAEPGTAAETHALVPVSTPAPRREIATNLRTSRPSAAFVTHLLATQNGDPQTRTRRMVGPDESAMRYAEALMRPSVAKFRSSLQVSM